jgi:hypothetical protein
MRLLAAALLLSIGVGCELEPPFPGKTDPAAGYTGTVITIVSPHVVVLDCDRLPVTCVFDAPHSLKVGDTATIKGSEERRIISHCQLAKPSAELGPKPQPIAEAPAKPDQRISKYADPAQGELLQGNVWRDFKDNEAAAEAKYRNKRVETAGIVKEVAKTERLGFYIVSIPQVPGVLTGKVDSVQCLCRDSDELRRLKADSSRVRIQGIPVEWLPTVTVLRLEECQILEIREPEQGSDRLKTVWKKAGQ